MFDLKKIIRPNIFSLKPYSSARDEFSGDEGVFLDANENPYGTLNRYPDSYQKELKDKLSEYKNMPIENIFIGNGSDEIMDLITRVFCNPGIDKALTFTPTFGMYQVVADVNNVELIKLPLDEDFQIDTYNLKSHLGNDKIKLIFICSPNNPTGNCFNESDVEYILKNFNGIVIIDEAYIDFSKTDSWLKTLEKYPNLIITQTFSKAWALASARVGIAYASEDIVQLLNKVKMPYNISKLNQQVAIDALENQPEFTKNIEIILKEKEVLNQALYQLDLVKKIYPSDANFLLVEFDNANKIYKDLVEQKIITRNRHTLVNNCIRITVGTPSENRQLLKALKKIES